MKSRFSADKDDNIVSFPTGKKGGNTHRKKAGGLRQEVSPTERYYETFMKRLGTNLKCDGQAWYLYDKKKGIWIVNDRERFNQQVINSVDPGKRNSVSYRDLKNYIEGANSLGLEDEFCGCVRWETGGLGNFLLNCPSEVLSIDRSGEIIEKLPHDSKWMFTHMLPADYREDAKSRGCTIFRQTLIQVLPDEKDRQLLLDFCATALLPHSEHECALICIGDGQNGKSVLFHAIGSALGFDNVSNITFSHICTNNRKHIHRLKKKLLNVSMETDVSKVSESSTFKTIVSGESFSTDQIYKEGYEMQTNCKLCFLTNSMLEFADGSSAEARRIRIIHFSQVFDQKRRNLNLKNQLEVEYEGILHLLIKRLPRICALKELPLGGRLSSGMHAAFRVSNNPVKAFVDGCLTFKLGSYTTREDIWQAFRKFAFSHDITLLGGKNEMFKKLYKYKPQLKYNSVRTLIEGEQKYVLSGVAIRHV